MRRFVKLSVFALFGTLLLGSALAEPPVVPAPPPTPPAEGAAPSGPSAHVKFDATEIDLGDVVRGEDAVASFTYHNTGEAPLHIISVKPG